MEHNVGTAGASRNNALIDANFVNVYINVDDYQLMDYNNSSIKPD